MSEGTRRRRLRLGMVAGGQDALIGADHRSAARMDDRYELVAGCFASTLERLRASAAELVIAGLGSTCRNHGDVTPLPSEQRHGGQTGDRNLL